MMARLHALLAFLAACAWGAPLPAQDGEPSWESLSARPTPAWFADARFGIFIHWGGYSVPAFCDTCTYSEWYQHWVETNAHGGLERRFHEANYGADFAYEDFAPMFRAELFDPEAWAGLLARSGMNLASLRLVPVGSAR